MLKVDKITGQDAVFGALQGFATQCNRSLFEELKITGRNIAVALAHGTLTVGLNNLAKTRGEKSVLRSLNRLIFTDSKVYEQIEEQSQADARKFWIAAQNDDTATMRTIMSANGLDMEITNVPRKHFHWARKRVLVRDAGAAANYIQQVQKQVGKAKAGWALAADACGGHRGIPAWASGSKHPDAKGGAVLTPGMAPSVVVYNRVSYIEEAMVATSVFETVRIAEERLLKRIEIIIEKETSATRMAA